MMSTEFTLFPEIYREKCDSTINIHTTLFLKKSDSTFSISGNLTKIFLSRACWFSLNSSERVEAVSLALCSIQYHYISDICAEFSIPNLPQSPDIGQNSDGGISNIQISGQSLI